MKKTFIIAGFLILAIGVMGVSSAFAEETTTTTQNNPKVMQISKFKSFIESLKSRLGIGRIENKIQKFEDKVKKAEDGIGKARNLVTAIQKKPGKAGMAIEELGNGKVNFTIRNAVITEIIQPDTLKVEIFGLTEKVKIASSTKVVRENESGSVLSEFAVGDYVSVWGTQDATDKNLIHATMVKDLSITKKDDDDDKEKVCIQVITDAKNPKTGICKSFPTPCAVPKGWTACTTSTNTSATSTSTN